MKLEIGNRIIWTSAAGVLVGEIYNIVLAPNAANKTIPWIDVKVEGRNNRVRLCASHDYLAQLKVALLETAGV